MRITICFTQATGNNGLTVHTSRKENDLIVGTITYAEGIIRGGVDKSAKYVGTTTSIFTNLPVGSGKKALTVLQAANQWLAANAPYPHVAVTLEVNNVRPTTNGVLLDNPVVVSVDRGETYLADELEDALLDQARSVNLQGSIKAQYNRAAASVSGDKDVQEAVKEGFKGIAARLFG